MVRSHEHIFAVIVSVSLISAAGIMFLRENGHSKRFSTSDSRKLEAQDLFPGKGKPAWQINKYQSNEISKSSGHIYSKSPYTIFVLSESLTQQPYLVSVFSQALQDNRLEHLLHEHVTYQLLDKIEEIQSRSHPFWCYLDSEGSLNWVNDPAFSPYEFATQDEHYGSKVYAINEINMAGCSDARCYFMARKFSGVTHLRHCRQNAIAIEASLVNQ